MNNFQNNYQNNIHRGFSPYGGKSSLNNLAREKEEALAYAKRLRDEHVNSLKNINLFKEAKKEALKQQELDKKFDEEKKKRLEKIKNISDKELQKSIEIAKKQNEKFKDKFTEDSSLDDLFNTLSDDLKSY